MCCAWELEVQRVVKDERPLEPEYVPAVLLHREHQLNALATNFWPVITRNSPRNAFIIGDSGMGKSVLATKFADMFEKTCLKHHRALQTLHISCRDCYTEHHVLTDIIQHLTSGIVEKGLSTPELLTILTRELKKRETHLLLILDDANMMVKSCQDLMFCLMRPYKTEADIGTISTIFIFMKTGGNEKDIVELLDPQLRSSLQKVIRLGRYYRPQLADILDQRAILALHPLALLTDARELILDIASENGDARSAIELLRCAAEVASNPNRPSANDWRITPECVRAARDGVNPFHTDSRLDMLNLDDHLVLLAIAYMLKRDEAYTTISEVEREYRMLCEGYKVPAVNRGAFFRIISDLVNKRVIAKFERRIGQRRETVISLPIMAAYLLAERLELRVELMQNQRT